MACFEFQGKIFNSQIDLLKYLKDTKNNEGKSLLEEIYNNDESLRDSIESFLNISFNEELLKKDFNNYSLYKTQIRNTYPNLDLPKELTDFVNPHIDKINYLYEKTLGFALLKSLLRATPVTNLEIDALETYFINALSSKKIEDVKAYGTFLMYLFNNYNLKHVIYNSDMKGIDKNLEEYSSIVFDILRNMENHLITNNISYTDMQSLQFAYTLFGDTSNDNFLFNNFLKKNTYVIEQQEEEDVSKIDRSGSPNFESNIPLETKALLSIIPLNTNQMVESYFVYKAFFNNMRNDITLLQGITNLTNSLHEAGLLIPNLTNEELQKYENEFGEITPYNYLSIFANMISIPIEGSNQLLLLKNRNSLTANLLYNIYIDLTNRKNNNKFYPVVDVNLYHYNTKTYDKVSTNLTVNVNQRTVSEMVNNQYVTTKFVIRDSITTYIENLEKILYNQDSVNRNYDYTNELYLLLKDLGFKFNFTTLQLYNYVNDKQSQQRFANVVSQLKSIKKNNSYNINTLVPLQLLRLLVHTVEANFQNEEILTIADPYNVENKSTFVYHLNHSLGRMIDDMEAFISKEINQEDYTDTEMEDRVKRVKDRLKKLPFVPRFIRAISASPIKVNLNTVRPSSIYNSGTTKKTGIRIEDAPFLTSEIGLIANAVDGNFDGFRLSNKSYIFNLKTTSNKNEINPVVFRNYQKGFVGNISSFLFGITHYIDYKSELGLVLSNKKGLEREQKIKALSQFLNNYSHYFTPEISNTFFTNNSAIETKGVLYNPVVQETMLIIKNRILQKIIESSNIINMNNINNETLDYDKFIKGSSYIYLKELFESLTEKQRQDIEVFINDKVKTIFEQIKSNNPYTSIDDLIRDINDNIKLSDNLFYFINHDSELNDMAVYTETIRLFAPLVDKLNTFHISKANDRMANLIESLSLVHPASLFKILNVFRSINKNYNSFIFRASQSNSENEILVNKHLDSFVKNVLVQNNLSDLIRSQASPLSIELLNTIINNNEFKALIKENKDIELANNLINNYLRVQGVFATFTKKGTNQDININIKEIYDIVFPIYMQMELNQTMLMSDSSIFFGELYTLQKENELYKRIAAIVSPGETSYVPKYLSNFEKDNLETNNAYLSSILENDEIKSVVIEDAVFDSAYLLPESLIKHLDDVTKEELKKTTPTDAAGVIHLDVAKILMKRFSLWSEEHDKAYDIIMEIRSINNAIKNGIIVTDDIKNRLFNLEIQLNSIGLKQNLFPVLKLQNAGLVSSSINNEMFTDKFALLPLIPELYPENEHMYSLLEWIETNKYHYFTFKSGTKLSNPKLLSSLKQSEEANKLIHFDNDRFVWRTNNNQQYVKTTNINDLKYNTPYSKNIKEVIPINTKFKVFAISSAKAFLNLKDSYNIINDIYFNGKGTDSEIIQERNKLKQELNNQVKDFEKSVNDLTKKLSENFKEKTGIDIQHANKEIDKTTFNNFIINTLKVLDIPKEQIGTYDVALHNPFLASTEPAVNNIINSIIKYAGSIARGDINGTFNVVVTPIISSPSLATVPIQTTEQLNIRIPFLKVQDYKHILTDKYYESGQNIMFHDKRLMVFKEELSNERESIVNLYKELVSENKIRKYSLLKDLRQLLAFKDLVDKIDIYFKDSNVNRDFLENKNIERIIDLIDNTTLYSVISDFKEIENSIKEDAGIRTMLRQYIGENKTLIFDNFVYNTSTEKLTDISNNTSDKMYSISPIKNFRSVNIPIQISSALATIDYGDLKGEVFTKELEKEIKDFILENPSKSIHNGESFENFFNRVTSAIRNFETTLDNNSVIVTHDTVVRLIKAWEDNGKPDILNSSVINSFFNIVTNTGSIHELKTDNKTFYLIRHGKTVDNALGLFRRDDTLLTDEGVKQAERDGKELTNKSVTSIVSSPMPRAISTAKQISNKLQESINKGPVENIITKSIKLQDIDLRTMVLSDDDFNQFLENVGVTNDPFNGLFFVRTGNQINVFIKEHSDNIDNQGNPKKEALLIYSLFDGIKKKQPELYKEFLNEANIEDTGDTNLALTTYFYSQLKSKQESNLVRHIIDIVKEIVKVILAKLNKMLSTDSNRLWYEKILKGINKNGYVSSIDELPSDLTLDLLSSLMTSGLLNINISDIEKDNFALDTIIVKEKTELKGQIIPDPIGMSFHPYFIDLLFLQHSDGDVIGSVSRLNEMLNNKSFVNKYILPHYTIPNYRIPFQESNFMSVSYPAQFYNSSTGSIVTHNSIRYPIMGEDNDNDKLNIFLKRNNVYLRLNKSWETIAEKLKLNTEDIKKLVDKFNKLPNNSVKKHDFLLSSDFKLLSILYKTRIVEPILAADKRYDEENRIIDTVTNLYNNSFRLIERNRANSMNIVKDIVKVKEKDSKDVKNILFMSSAFNTSAMRQKYLRTGKAIGTNTYLQNVIYLYQGKDVLKIEDEVLQEYFNLPKLVLSFDQPLMAYIIDNEITSLVDITKDDTGARLGWFIEKKYGTAIKVLISSLIYEKAEKLNGKKLQYSDIKNDLKELVLKLETLALEVKRDELGIDSLGLYFPKAVDKENIGFDILNRLKKLSNNVKNSMFKETGTFTKAGNSLDSVRKMAFDNNTTEPIESKHSLFNPIIYNNLISEYRAAFIIKGLEENDSSYGQILDVFKTTLIRKTEADAIHNHPFLTDQGATILERIVNTITKASSKLDKTFITEVAKNYKDINRDEFLSNMNNFFNEYLGKFVIDAYNIKFEYGLTIDDLYQTITNTFNPYSLRKSEEFINKYKQMFNIMAYDKVIDENKYSEEKREGINRINKLISLFTRMSAMMYYKKAFIDGNITMATIVPYKDFITVFNSNNISESVMLETFNNLETIYKNNIADKKKLEDIKTLSYVANVMTEVISEKTIDTNVKTNIVFNGSIYSYAKQPIENVNDIQHNLLNEGYVYAGWLFEDIDNMIDDNNTDFTSFQNEVITISNTIRNVKIDNNQFYKIDNYNQLDYLGLEKYLDIKAMQQTVDNQDFTKSINNFIKGEHDENRIKKIITFAQTINNLFLSDKTLAYYLTKQENEQKVLVKNCE